MVYNKNKIAETLCFGYLNSYLEVRGGVEPP